MVIIIARSHYELAIFGEVVRATSGDCADLPEFLPNWVKVFSADKDRPEFLNSMRILKHAVEGFICNKTLEYYFPVEWTSGKILVDFETGCKLLPLITSLKSWSPQYHIYFPIEARLRILEVMKVWMFSNHPLCLLPKDVLYLILGYTESELNLTYFVTLDTMQEDAWSTPERKKIARAFDILECFFSEHGKKSCFILTKVFLESRTWDVDK